MTDHLVMEIQTLFLDKKWTLSTAESCTGGAIAARVTRNSGASGYFLGGFVVYSNELKEKILQISPLDLAQYGAVSQETVSKMAEHAINLTGSDFAIAVSGIAGPSGGSISKPVGTVWIAIMKQGQTAHTLCLQAKGHREAIIDQSTQVALEELLKYSASFRHPPL